MTREVIFETIDRGEGLWKKISTRFCCHVDTRLMDIIFHQGMEDKLYVQYSIIIWKCVECERRQLWICREEIIPKQSKWMCGHCGIRCVEYQKEYPDGEIYISCPRCGLTKTKKETKDEFERW